MRKQHRIIFSIMLIFTILSCSLSAAHGAELDQAESSGFSFLSGDADNSGTIDLLDATCIQRYIAQLDSDIYIRYLLCGDVNGDMSLGIDDATFIQRYIANINIPYAIGENVSVEFDNEWAWPTPGNYYITTQYGEGRSYETHYAIDIGASMGTPVYAANSGTVVSANNSCTHNGIGGSWCNCGGGYGNYIWILHNNGYETIYGHLTSTAVDLGTYVTKNQLIGYVGSTGWSSGPHLHFELRIDGVRYNPMQLY